MDKVYWYLEYTKVLLGYIALLYIWPGFVFRKYLKGKGLIFRFLFCSTAQILLINSVVLGLGLLHILNEWVVRGLFYGVLMISAGELLISHNKRNHIVEQLLGGTCKWKIFGVRLWESVLQRSKICLKKYGEHLVEYLLLGVIVVFGMIYFSYGSFQDYTYGASDLYVHHSWIYGLQMGEIFSDGIYPQAMHCFIYCMRVLFGVNVYSSLLLLGSIHGFTFLIAAFCLFKKIFYWQYTPLYVLLAFLVFDGAGGGGTQVLIRLQYTLPQEFGLYLVFLCPLILICALQAELAGEKKWYRNDMFLLLAFGVGAVLSIHFYPLIMAFLICIIIVVLYAVKIFSEKRIYRLVYSVVSGAVLGGLPMILSYILGKDLQHSLNWGVDIINGSASNATKAEAEITDSYLSITQIFRNIFEKEFVVMFGGKGAVGITFFFLVSIICILAGGLYIHFIHGKRQYEANLLSGMLRNYLLLILAASVFIILYAAPFIGLPELISIRRLCIILRMLVCSAVAVLIDFLLFFTSRGLDQNVLRLETILSCVIIYCTAFLFDFHEFMNRGLMRYNAVVDVTLDIMETYPEYSYTIVSPTDELYQIIEAGRHEELLLFTQKVKEKEYFLPTEYIFLYVEKHPICGQTHFISGPQWLAQTVFKAIANERSSLCPEIAHTEISREESEKNVELFSEPNKNYRDMESRTILESQAYYWFQEFSVLYPVETSVYYEDDDFVCYCIHQSAESQINLALGEG